MWQLKEIDGKKLVMILNLYTSIFIIIYALFSFSFWYVLVFGHLYLWLPMFIYNVLLAIIVTKLNCYVLEKSKPLAVFYAVVLVLWLVTGCVAIIPMESNKLFLFLTSIYLIVLIVRPRLTCSRNNE